MLYIHEKNLQTKIRTNYKNKAREIQNLYDTVYLPMRTEISSLTFSEANPDAFVRATEIFNAYYDFLSILGQHPFITVSIASVLSAIPAIINAAKEYFRK